MRCRLDVKCQLGSNVTEEQPLSVFLAQFV